MRFLIFLISSISFSTFVAAGADVRDIIPGGVKCSRDGPMCKDCMTLVNCVKAADDFEVKFVAACTNDAPCDESKKGCVYGGTCRYKPFECSGLSDGIYPDPYSCRQYHSCQEERNTDLSCTFPKAYNPKTGVCDLMMNHSQCTAGPLAVCLKNNQTLIMNDLFYYTCTLENQPYKTLYPKLPTEPQCDSHEYIPDPKDCEAYYYCSKTSDGKYNLKHMHCRPGSHFDPAKLRCIIGPCP